MNGSAGMTAKRGASMSVPVQWLEVDMEYWIRAWVFLDARDIKTTHPSPKLAHSYLRPYVIQWKVGRNAYRLKLLESVTHIHPVFNIVKLLPVPDDPIPGQQTKSPPPPEIMDGEDTM